MSDLLFFFKQDNNLYAKIQTFEWFSEDEKTRIIFDVTQLLLDIKNGKIKVEKIEAPIDRDFALTWLIQRDLNYYYISNLTEEYINIPVLSVEMPGGTYLTIDGSHRYMARFLLKRPTIKHLLVNREDWQPYAEIFGEKL